MFITTDHLITLLLFHAAAWVSKTCIAWEHLSYTVLTSNFWKKRRLFAYTRIKAVVALNPVEAAFYVEQGCKTYCIPNAIQQQYIRTLPHPATLLWMGGLTLEKGIDDVVKAGSIIKARQLPLTIHVYGTGEKQQWLQQEISRLGLHNIIFYKGVTTNVQAAYTNASVLVLTSRHECFPTVILEAFSYGVPVVSYNCPTGPATMVRENVNGKLIPVGNVEQLVDAVASLESNSVSLQEMSKNAFDSVLQYSPSIVSQQWNDLLHTA